MGDRLGPWGEVAARQADADAYAEAVLLEPLQAKLARKGTMITLTLAIALIAIVVVLAGGTYATSACGAAAGYSAAMLYQDRFEPRGVRLGLKVAGGFDGRNAAIEALWHAIGRRIQTLRMLRIATLVVMVPLIVWPSIS